MKISRSEIRAFFLETIPDYLLELFPKLWVVLIAVVASIVGAIIDMGGVDVPSWVWWTAIAISIFISQFLLWMDVRKERDQLKKYNIRQEAIDRLTYFRNQIISLQNEDPSDDAAFGALRQRYNDKRKEIATFLRENLTPAEAKLFERFGDYATVLVTGKSYVNMDHINIVARMIRDHRWLEKAAQDYGRQRFRPELVSELEEEQDDNGAG